MTPVRVGVIGFGLAGQVFHAPFVSAIPELQLSAIVQRSGDQAARAYPSATIFRSPEDLFRSDVDLVVIGTPNVTHVPFATAALHAGKHVVIDKPIASTSEEAVALENLANEKGLLLAPFHNRRFDGDFLTVRKLLEEGRIGRPVTFVSRFDRFRPAQKQGTWKESAGPEHGLLMDLGPHLIDQAIVLFGRPETISASVRTDRDVSEIEDAFDLTLTFRDGQRTIRVELGATMLAADPQPRFLLNGTLGSYRKLGVDQQEPKILAGAVVPSLGSDTDWLSEDPTSWGMLTTATNPSAPGELSSTPLATQRGDYRSFYSAIASAIQHGTSLPAVARDGVRVARIIELARASSAAGKTLNISPQGW